MQITHATCPVESHHPDWDDADAAGNPEQAAEHGHLSCNDEGAPMFYCDEDNWYHHANAGTPACFLIQEDGTAVAGARFSAADAALLIADGPTVHTFVQQGSVTIGEDWPRDKVIALLEEGNPEIAGPVAAGMHHGLVAFDAAGGAVYIETRYTPPLDRSNAS